MKTRAIVMASDTHAGGSTALCPEGPIELDDGGSYNPSLTQRWLWSKWKEMWGEWVPGEFERFGVNKWMYVHNGDAFEGDHHNTYQILTRHPGAQFEVAMQNHRVPLGMDPSKVVWVRGTESHNGKGNSNEEALGSVTKAAGAPVEMTPEGKYSWWQYRCDVWGTRFDFTHHGRTGQRAHTFPNAANLYAADIALTHLQDGVPHPHYAIRGHFHRENDSYDKQPTRVIQLPAWQSRTSYTWKKVPDTVSDIGLVMVICRDDGTSEVRKNIIKMTRDRSEVVVWK